MIDVADPSEDVPESVASTPGSPAARTPGEEETRLDRLSGALGQDDSGGVPAAGVPAAGAPVRGGKLDDAARRTLLAVVRRILPSSDGVGAAEAGCPEYVLRWVETRLYPGTLGKVERGLAFADKLARQMCGAPFYELAETDQDRVLTQLQRTPHPTPQYLLHRLVTLTLEGFLCDPRHGGNRGGVGWRYLGIRDVESQSPALEEGPCTTS